ncbi:nicotinamide riboside transporter PnuC [soil metagenome]
MHFLDIKHIAFEALGYPISYVELAATFFGLISIYLASRANILTWPTGIINEFFLFVLFFQIQLYPDMFLQVHFFIVTLYGWYHWRAKPSQVAIATINPKARLLLATSIGVGSLVAGYFFANIHLYLPTYFELEAAYPYADSFIMVCSIVATVLLATKKLESWYLWIAVDLVCTILYFQKGIYFLSLEYLIFLGLASYGLYHWKQQLKHG